MYSINTTILKIKEDVNKFILKNIDVYQSSKNPRMFEDLNLTFDEAEKSIHSAIVIYFNNCIGDILNSTEVCWITEQNVSDLLKLLNISYNETLLSVHDNEVTNKRLLKMIVKTLTNLLRNKIISYGQDLFKNDNMFKISKSIEMLKGYMVIIVNNHFSDLNSVDFIGESFKFISAIVEYVLNKKITQESELAYRRCLI